jgi:hypothetical protein
VYYLRLLDELPRLELLLELLEELLPRLELLLPEL